MLTNVEIKSREVGRAAVRQANGKPYFSKQGELNLVAFVAKSPKGGHTTVLGSEVGVLGRDGEGAYVIREAAVGAQGPMRLYCSCPAQKFHAGYGNPCKHIAKLLAEADFLRAADVFENAKLQVWSFPAIERAQHAMMDREAAEAAKATAKVA